MSANTNSETTWLNLDGFRYCYQKHGDCRKQIPVLFLSGAFQSMASWRKFQRFFVKRGFPVILVDLPGAGNADVLPEEYSIDFLAEATAKVIRESGAGRVHLASASYGSPIAYRCAELQPAMIESLTLAGIMKQIPMHVRPAIEQNLRTLLSGDMHRFAREGIEGGFLCRDQAKPINRRDFTERVLYHSMVGMSSHSKRQYISNTRRLLRQQTFDLCTTHSIRSLVFTGEYDTFTRPEYCREVAENLNNYQFTTIRHADHLFHIQQFTTTAELLWQFTAGDNIEVDGIGDITQSTTCSFKSTSLAAN